MADIRNDQYLHRPGAGRGAITPADPLEARIFDGNGNPISPATAAKQDQILSALGNLENTVGTEATLAAVKSVLDSLTEFLSTRFNANLSTRASEQTLVQVRDALSALAGTVDAGAQKVTLTGQTVTIGGVNYTFDPPRTLYGPAASRPSASDAHAAVPYVVYVSVDTKAIEQTDGTAWRRWGVV